LAKAVFWVRIKSYLSGVPCFLRLLPVPRHTNGLVSDVVRRIVEGLSIIVCCLDELRISEKARVVKQLCIDLVHQSGRMFLGGGRPPSLYPAIRVTLDKPTNPRLLPNHQPFSSEAFSRIKMPYHAGRAEGATE